MANERDRDTGKKRDFERQRLLSEGDSEKREKKGAETRKTHSVCMIKTQIETETLLVRERLRETER